MREGRGGSGGGSAGVGTLTFGDVDGKTLVGWRQVFDSAAERQRIASFVTEANEQNLERLAAEVLRAA